MIQTDDTLERARAAARRRAWRDACELYESVDDSMLTADDLDAKADALWWVSRVHDGMGVRQKAYVAHVADGNDRRAAYAAWFLSIDSSMNGESSISSGWKMRARRHLANERDCVEHGLLALLDAGDAHERGDLDEAMGLANSMIDLAKRLGDPNLMALGTQALGRYRIAAGDVKEGTALLDEAMASVVAGLIDPTYTGMIFCDVLRACVEIGDVARASEWTDAARRWYESIPAVSPVQGICRIHRVEVATLRGEWDEAESDAKRASADLATVHDGLAAAATYALGEIYRRRGNLQAAEAEFQRAHVLGRDPHPGLALVRLAEGRAAAAAAALRLPLLDDRADPFARACLLSAKVQVSIATDDVGSARSACDELSSLAERWQSPMLRATAWSACAATALAEGDADAAAVQAHRACRQFHDLRLPHEAALARLLLGMACRKGGDDDRGTLEIAAARDELERIGAKLDARAAAAMLATADRPAGLSQREIEVLRLVAAGKTNREIAAEMVLSEHTISRHLQNIFRKLGVQTRAAATAFAFENGVVRSDGADAPSPSA